MPAQQRRPSVHEAAVSGGDGPPDVLQLSPTFLPPNLEVDTVQFTDWGEALLPLWLLMKSENVERWENVISQQSELFLPGLFLDLHEGVTQVDIIRRLNQRLHQATT